VVSIDPTTPVNVGGYASPTDGPLQFSNDPLQVRAFVVANGNKAVAFAVVDSTGWFAEYQGAMAGNGQYGARVDAATALASHGFNVDRTAVMVSTTHSHATPSMVGIWGDMGTANQAYVKQVHDAVVAAVDQAASHLKTSELWFANGDIRSVIWQNGSGTDVVDGYSVDSQMPVLWARDPATGATNALYVNIPNHPDTFRARNGTTIQGFSADVPGYVRQVMDEGVGGISVVASGTLGRQESPGRNSDWAEVGHQGDYVSSAIRLAMANATPLKSNLLASSETPIQATVGASASDTPYYQYNQGLLILMKASAPGAASGYAAATGGTVTTGTSTCFTGGALNGTCALPRALSSTWCQGAACAPGTGAGPVTLGTYTTALRIGSLLYVSNPGESFAEVNNAIRSEVVDAQSINVVGLAGDFLGYNWSTSDYTNAQFTSSDFGKYNVGPDLAQRTADGGYANAAVLGFQVASAKVTVKAAGNPITGMQPVSTGITLPGIQFYPSQVESAPNSLTFYGSTTQPQAVYSNPPPHSLSEISWDFGDNKPGVTTAGTYFDHLFTAPGVYNVSAQVSDMNTGQKRTWKQTVTIDPPLSLTLINRQGAPSVVAAGGQGTLIAATWSCTDGTVTMGLTSSCANGGVKAVTAMDGAGTLASLTVSH
jgi:hypothetical protein